MTTSQNGFNSQKSTLNSTASGLNSIDSLLSGIQWAPNFNGTTALTYSFPWAQASTASWATNPNYSTLNEPNSAFALTMAQQQGVRDALATWSQVANVTFTEVSDAASNVGDLRFAWTQVDRPGAAAWASYPNDYWASGGDVWLSHTAMGNAKADSWQPGGYSFFTLIHEMGHALGLKHPFEDSPTLPTAMNTRQYSVMSYTDHTNAIFLDVTPQKSGGYSFQYENIEPQTPMLYDVAAIQYLYGANTSYRTGNDTYTFDPTKPFFQTLWDAGGTDTISVFNFSTDCTIDLSEGRFSSIAIPSDAIPPGYSGGTTPTYNGTNNLAIAFGCLIENATGGQGNDTLIGNAANNLLLGGGGNDLLIGGAGNDEIDGGSGTDTARLEGAFSTYTISYNSSLKQHTISGAASGTDTYTNVEFFQFSDVLRTASSLATIDLIAPTVVGFAPADEATGVAVASNITLTFSEAIARGTGTVVLKTAAGSTVATYNAATSSNITLSGSVLTLNPTADLTAGTAYRVEFSAGSIQDLAGNPFAGTTSYNFTTASGTVVTPPGTSLGPTDDFVVLQPSTPAIAGAGVGNDVYLLSGSMLPAGKAITLSDSLGINTLQLAPGLSIASSQVSAAALKLTLTNGASLTVLGANKFSYDVGGNLSAGLDQPDLSYSQFVQNILGTTVPTSGLASGAALKVGSGPAASLLASASSGDDFIVAQAASTAIIGGGMGNDTYLISPGLLPAGKQISISDAQGTNSIQLASGLQIASAQVAAKALKLTLTNGASITVLGADQFTFEAGGNTTAGMNQLDLSYAQFVQSVLGVSVPTTGLVTSGAITIGGNAIRVTGNQVISATAATEVFSFDVASAIADVAGTNTQATITGFSAANDRLMIDLPIANGSLTNLGQLDGVQGVSVQINPFAGATLVNFGSDANGAQPVTLTLVGILDASTVQIQVV